MFGVYAKQLKTINDQIYQSATQKAFYQDILNYIQITIDGNTDLISDILGGMLSTAIWYHAHDESFDGWKNQAEVSLLCLGGIDINLQEFFSEVKSKCTNEIQACFYAESKYQLGGDIHVIEEEVVKILKRR